MISKKLMFVLSCLHLDHISTILTCFVQFTGRYLQGTTLKELREISPNRTRAERKLLLQRIRDIEAASQVGD